MSRECEICGKKPLKSASLTFSHKQNVKRQAPNLQSVRVKINGEVKTIKVCTSCISAGKIDNIKAV
ncbi:MAG: 50S ribosomal protein L28 [Candidatus Gastranaerophilaceae bacterium]